MFEQLNFIDHPNFYLLPNCFIQEALKWVPPPWDTYTSF